MGQLPFEKFSREILIKKESITDANLGRDPNKISTDELIEYGVVNIDKCKGPTSHQISDFVQKVLHINKSGHSGSLDPGVTGVLPVALGRATRVVEALLKAGKEYICIMHLHKEVDEKELMRVIKRFTGRIKQRPPLKSAVKRVERYREIYYIEIIEIDGKDVFFRVGCEAGTYIRVLCHQIGQELGTGAHMAELRRTRAGPFDENTLVTLQDLADAYHYYKQGNDKFLRECIHPIEFAVTHLQKIWVMDNAVDSICHGVDLKVPGIAKVENGIEPDRTIAVMTLKDELIGVGIAKLAAATIMKADKGIAVKISKVFMKPGLYLIKK